MPFKLLQSRYSCNFSHLFYKLTKSKLNMLLFKTSGKTINSVVANQKHAFKGQPKNWEQGEIVLVSKNRTDCKPGEKQIQHIMFLDKIRETNDDEFEKYWPNNKGRWKFIADCIKTVKLQKPFNIEEILGPASIQDYGPVVTFKKVEPADEQLIIKHLKSINAID